MARRADLQLSREAIVEAGLGILRSEGIDALTVRGVAAELGVSPMALYPHVGNKEGLLDAIVGRLMDSLKIDLDSESDWTVQAEQWAHALRDQLRDYFGMLRMLTLRRAEVIRCTRPLFRALYRAGFDREASQRITRALIYSTMGFLLIEEGLQKYFPYRDGARVPTPPRPGSPAFDPGPAVEGPEDVEAHFRLQVRLMVAGLAAEHAPGRAAPEAS